MAAAIEGQLVYRTGCPPLSTSQCRRAGSSPTAELLVFFDVVWGPCCSLDCLYPFNDEHVQ